MLSAAIRDGRFCDCHSVSSTGATSFDAKPRCTTATTRRMTSSSRARRCSCGTMESRHTTACGSPPARRCTVHCSLSSMTSTRSIQSCSSGGGDATPSLVRSDDGAAARRGVALNPPPGTHVDAAASFLSVVAASRRTPLCFDRVKRESMISPPQRSELATRRNVGSFAAVLAGHRLATHTAVATSPMSVHASRTRSQLAFTERTLRPSRITGTATDECHAAYTLRGAPSPAPAPAPAPRAASAASDTAPSESDPASLSSSSSAAPLSSSACTCALAFPYASSVAASSSIAAPMTSSQPAAPIVVPATPRTRFANAATRSHAPLKRAAEESVSEHVPSESDQSPTAISMLHRATTVSRSVADHAAAGVAHAAPRRAGRRPDADMRRRIAVSAACVTHVALAVDCDCASALRSAA